MNLADLRALGVEVSLNEEGKLRLRAAPGVLTPQLRQAIVEVKPRLLDELQRHRQEPVNVVNIAQTAITMTARPPGIQPRSDLKKRSNRSEASLSART